jgi:cysteinyl-tRNA synthetase
MALVLTNSLTKKKEPFLPLNPNLVRMYVCGPTVYNYVHIGNARVFVFYDVVERYLKFLGYQVERVMNFTDVDDKIINKAREEKSDSLVVSERYIAEFLTDMQALRVTPPKVSPKVTDHIPEIIKLIEGLVANGSAYVAPDGEVFFSVRNFKDYGKLSGKNIDDLISGARVQTDEKKRDPLDFSLWKPQKNSNEPTWDSPWGKGRPGWHIECSAMSMKYLGESFDIHGGGMDLIHPHHENEIAQSEALTHKTFARFWIHSNMLTFNAEKMSKSLGNIMLTRDFIKKYSGEVLRYFLLSGHYRSTIDYSDQHIREVQSALHRFYTALSKAELGTRLTSSNNTKPSPEEEKLAEFGKEFEAKWREAMDEDLNTAKVIGLVFEYVRLLNAYIDKKGFKPTALTQNLCQQFVQSFQKLSQVLNIFGEAPSQFLTHLRLSVLEEKKIAVSEIETKIKQRAEARVKKDFAISDAIRNDLLNQGVELRDLPGGTEWDILFKN